MADCIIVGSTCEPLASVDDVVVCCPAFDDLDETQQTFFLQAASDYVAAKLAWTFKGVCETTGRPCPACPCAADCHCGPYPKIDLGADPVAEIVEVSIDGDVLDPSEYRVDAFRWLVRLDGADGKNAGWPRVIRQAAPQGGVGAFEVTWRHGACTPPLVIAAVAAVACQFQRACAGGESCLPPNVTQLTRQGTSMTLDTFMNGLQQAAALTVLPAVAAAIDAYNPHGWRARSSVDDISGGMVYPGGYPVS